MSFSREVEARSEESLFRFCEIREFLLDSAIHTKIAESKLKNAPRGSIFRRFCGFSSSKLRDRTDGFIEQLRAQNPAKASKRQRAFFKVR
ncbi:hypothetical protein [Helicobacter sp. 23-1045]